MERISEARESTDAALAREELGVSAISFWETAMLESKGRLSLHQPPHAWRAELLESGLREIPVSGEIGILASSLPDLHPDPADRIIVATASLEGATMLTADRRILDWPGPVMRRDARE